MVTNVRKKYFVLVVSSGLVDDIAGSERGWTEGFFGIGGDFETGLVGGVVLRGEKGLALEEALGGYLGEDLLMVEFVEGGVVGLDVAVAAVIEVVLVVGGV